MRPVVARELIRSFHVKEEICLLYAEAPSRRIHHNIMPKRSPVL